MEREDRSANFGLAPLGSSSDTANLNVVLRWNEDGFHLTALCPPPGDLSVPRQVREPDFLGYRQTHDQYMDSLVVRFARGQLHAVPQSYSLLLQQGRETHFWDQTEDAFPLASICDPWQADARFCVPTLAWLADACRTALGLKNAVTGPQPDAVQSPETAQVGNLKCDIWTFATADETRIYWTDPTRGQLILKCFIQFPNGRPRRRYDFTYEEVKGTLQLRQVLLLQLTAAGGVHDQVLLRRKEIASFPGAEVAESISFPNGTLVSDFQKRAQWLIRENGSQRLTSVRDTVLRRGYADIVSGSTPVTVARTWVQGFPPTRDELWEACWTWQTLGGLVMGFLLFCLIPRRKMHPQAETPLPQNGYGVSIPEEPRS